MTYDDVNQREWLDLTETQLFKFPGATLEEQYSAVISQTSPGGVFEGFDVGTRSEVISLAVSGGINTSTTNCNVNALAAQQLATLLGDVYSGLPNRTSAGFVADHPVPYAVAISFDPIARTDPAAGVFAGPIASNFNGVWLIRAIPEAAILGLVTQGVLVLSFVLRRSR